MVASIQQGKEYLLLERLNPVAGTWIKTFDAGGQVCNSLTIIARKFARWLLHVQRVNKNESQSKASRLLTLSLPDMRK